MPNKLVSVDDGLHLPSAVQDQLRADLDADFSGYVSTASAASSAAVSAASDAETARDQAIAAAASGTPGEQGPPGPPGPSGLSYGSLRANAIFNGNLALCRLGTSVPSLVHLSRTFDRFIYGQQGAGSVLRWDADSDVPDSSVPYSSKFTVTSASAVGAGQEKHVRYAIEGYDFVPYRGQDATLSFWVKSNLAGTYCVAFTNYARDRTFVREYTITAVDTWQEIVMTVPFGSVTGGSWNYTDDQGIGIRWAMASDTFYQGTKDVWNSANVTSTSAQVNLGATVGNYIKFAKIQLNIGTTQLPYTYRSREENLALCSRYLQVFNDGAMRRSPVSSVTTTTVTEIYVPLATELRGLPKVSLIGTRGTDWALRGTNDGEFSTGTLQASPSYGKASGLIRFESGTYTAGTAMHILLITSAGQIVFDAEL